MKRIVLGVLLLGLIACTAILMTACGGGGGGGGSSSDGIGPPPATTLAINEANASTLASLAMFGGTIGDAAGGGVTPFQAADADSDAPMGLIQFVLIRVKEEAMTLSADYQANGGAAGSDYCPGGGTMTANLRWDGPTTEYCSDWRNLRGSMTMSNCGVEGAVMSGRIGISTSGVFCNPSAMSLKFTNFDFSEGSISFSSDTLRISVTDINRSGDTITAMHSVTTGDVNGSVDGNDYDAEFYQYTEDMQPGVDSDYTLDISGSVRGGCLGPEWAAIETLQLVKLDSGSDCPIGGELMVSGTGSETITFNSDGSVDVGTTHHDSCDDLEDNCVAAP